MNFVMFVHYFFNQNSLNIDPLWHASKICQKCIKSATWCLQDAPKTPPGRPKTDFASVFGAHLEPSWPPFSVQDGPRGLQDAPRCPLERGTHPYFWAPNMKSRLDHLRTPILGDFWLIFDGFLIDFWWFFFLVFWLEYYIDYQIDYYKEYIEHIKIYLQHGQLGGGNAACRAEDKKKPCI